MSRSYKKHGIIKDKGMSRGEYNRRFRRVNRQLIKEGKNPKLMYEVINPYDVCDYKMYWGRGYFYHLFGKIENLKDSKSEKRRRTFFNK